MGWDERMEGIFSFFFGWGFLFLFAGLYGGIEVFLGSPRPLFLCDYGGGSGLLGGMRGRVERSAFGEESA